MKFSAILCAATVAFSSATYADEACAPEALQSKMTEASTAMQAIAMKDPARMQELSLEMQAKMAEMQTGGDLTAVCEFYDAVIAEAAG